MPSGKPWRPPRVSVSRSSKYRSICRGDRHRLAIRFTIRGNAAASFVGRVASSIEARSACPAAFSSRSSLLGAWRVLLWSTAVVADWAGMQHLHGIPPLYDRRMIRLIGMPHKEILHTAAGGGRENDPGSQCELSLARSTASQTSPFAVGATLVW